MVMWYPVYAYMRYEIVLPKAGVSRQQAHLEIENDKVSSRLGIPFFFYTNGL